MEQRRAPRDRCAPIVTYKEDFLLPELVCNGDDIRDEFRECVRSDASGFAAEVVAALVWHDDAKARGGQRRDLFVPAIPKLREAVEKNYDRTILRTCGDGMQRSFAILEGKCFQGVQPHSRFYLPERHHVSEQKSIKSPVRRKWRDAFPVR